MTKEMLKTGLFLFAVAAISGTLLAFSESLTAPVIKQNQLNAETEAQNNVLPSWGNVWSRATREDANDIGSRNLDGPHQQIKGKQDHHRYSQ